MSDASTRSFTLTDFTRLTEAHETAQASKIIADILANAPPPKKPRAVRFWQLVRRMFRRAKEAG